MFPRNINNVLSRYVYLAGILEIFRNNEGPHRYTVEKVSERFELLQYFFLVDSHHFKKQNRYSEAANYTHDYFILSKRRNLSVKPTQRISL